MILLRSALALSSCLGLVSASSSSSSSTSSSSSSSMARRLLNEVVSHHQRAAAANLFSSRRRSLEDGSDGPCAAEAAEAQSCVAGAVAEADRSACFDCVQAAQEAAVGELRADAAAGLDVFTCETIDGVVCPPIETCDCVVPCVSELGAMFECLLGAQFEAANVTAFDSCDVSCGSSAGGGSSTGNGTSSGGGGGGSGSGGGSSSGGEDAGGDGGGSSAVGTSGASTRRLMSATTMTMAMALAVGWTGLSVQ